jgi:hypothetical protein
MDRTYPYDFDKFNLDEEWVKQPRLYYDAAVELADARAAYERLRTLKEVTAAEIDAEVRRDPKTFGLDKVTEGSVEKAVVRDARYAKVCSDIIDAKHHVDICQAKVDTLDHRKHALQDVVDLQNAGYFARPVAGTREGRESTEEIELQQLRRKGQYKPENNRRS